MDDLLLDELVGFAHRPYDHVMWCYPWGEEGTELEEKPDGPQGWQKQLLLDLQRDLLAAEREPGAIITDAWQAAIKSGHDVGKSAVQCWLIRWAVGTRVDTRGRVTANTEKQLSKTLWPELAKWHNLSIDRDLWKHTATSYISADPEHALRWRVDAIPWSEDSTEGFAGLHNQGGRAFVLFDEASGIIDRIWEVVDGVMFEGGTELFWIVTGNPTRATGRFRQCFDEHKSFWHTYTVDSRDVPWTNKDRIERAIALYGVESDYVKVRFLGQFPEQSTNQMFPTGLIRDAQTRAVSSQPWEALTLGVDVARFGKNESVLTFRRGKDARTIPAQRYRGLSTTDLAARIAFAIAQYQPDAVFVDEGGIGGGVIDHLRHLGHHVIGVQFGGKPGGHPGGVRVLNKRAEMHQELLLAMQSGLAIENSEDLRTALQALEFFFQKKTELLTLVAKEDLQAEAGGEDLWLDGSDSLALTYAFPVSKRAWAQASPQAKMDYNPLSVEALEQGAMH